MGSSFINIPYDAIAARRRRVPYDAKDADEIPLDGMQSVSPQSQPARELPIASSYAKDSDQTSAAQPEIPLGQIATVQPLSREQEIDLAPIPESDRTRQEYQSLYNAGTPKPQMPDHSNEHHGFWGNAWQHLKHGAKGAAIGALLGSRAGGGGALGGALLGGLTGAVSPRAADTMEYRTLTEPRWEHENQIAQEEAARKGGVARDYAQQFGTALFDPNRHTEMAQNRDEAAKDRQARQTALEYDRAEKNKLAHEKENRLAGSQKLGNLRRLWEKGGLTDPKDKAMFAQLSGVSGALADAYINGEATEDTDEQGRMVIVHKQTGQRELVTDPDTGQPVTSFKLTQVKAANERAAESRKIQQQNANTNADRATEGMRHNQATESQAATNETGRATRSKDKKGGILEEIRRGIGGSAQPAPHDAAISVYQSYVQANPSKREAARQKFIKQRGYDPEAQ